LASATTCEKSQNLIPEVMNKVAIKKQGTQWPKKNMKIITKRTNQKGHMKEERKKLQSSNTQNL